MIIPLGGFSSLMSLTIGDLIGVDKLMAGFCITNFLATIPALLLPAAAGQLIHKVINIIFIKVDFTEHIITGIEQFVFYIMN